jgi:hypothetical protein
MVHTSNNPDPTVPHARRVRFGTVGLLACSVAVIALGLYWTRRAPDAPPTDAVSTPPDDGGPRRYPRAELNKLLWGKTKAEVTDLLGPPDETQIHPELTEIWTYTGRTREKDPNYRVKTNLYFTGDKVTSLVFQN